VKKFLVGVMVASLILIFLPIKASAAGGIYASGGGTKTVGQTFTVTVSASGATFNALEGTISVSGPVSVSSFSAGGATWTSVPANGVHFVGMVAGGTDSLTVASIKLKATGAGNGSVSVSSVRLANGGVDVGSGAGSASFSIAEAPDLPGSVKVSSSTHPDPNAAYEATTIALSWTKESGVDAFSYLIDQAEGTTPAAKTTDANTSVTYANKAIGTYYFHIRAHKADGWGATTHFKINIKEPDAKIDEKLSKPSGIKIERDAGAVNNIDNGTLTGVIITGKTEPGFTANFTLEPTPTLPEGKTLTAVADIKGEFKLLINYPLKAGYYKLTIQGQKEKVLTPISDPIKFEISLKDGGVINIITTNDIKPPAKTISAAVKGAFLKQEYSVMTYLIVTLCLAILILGIIELVKFIKRKRRGREQGII
jgi:hypothetical protein